ncbi:hypothetical protein ABK040_008232 [Willaertia magna]
MVIIAVSIVSKSGKALLARTFRDISRVRLEGLLSAFPKLMDPKSQHTFVETEAVRYVYQSMDQLILLLITTKTSNIVEDLDTLQLISRTVKDICFANQRNSAFGITEEVITSNSFELLFSFDEIVSLGYKESVNVQQVKDILRMDSQEENFQNIIYENKVSSAQLVARNRAAEIALEKAKNQGKYTSGISSGDSSKGGRMGDNIYNPSPSISSGGSSKFVGIGSNSSGAGNQGNTSPSIVSTSSSNVGFGTSDKKNVKQQAKPSNLSSMILNRPKKKQGLLNELVQEGGINNQELPEITDNNISTSKLPEIVSATEMKKKREEIDVEIKETLNVETNRDGGLNSLDVKGEMYLTIADNGNGFIKVRLIGDPKDGFVTKLHPNIDKKLFSDEHCLALKRKDKEFPTGNPLKILTWRSQGNFDETILPFTVNCWPNTSSNDTTVSLEYTLQDTNIELHNVVITVPIPSTNVKVESNEHGTFKIDNKNSAFVWSFDIIDSSNASGNIEFVINERSDENKFFPVDIKFSTNNSISGVSIENVVSVNDDSEQRFSSNTSLTVSDYKIV